jgi:hypothetical protein
MRSLRLMGWCCAAVVVGGCGGISRYQASDGTGGMSSSAGGAPSALAGGAGVAGVAGEAPFVLVDAFETPDTFVSPGLWMGFAGNTLPIGTPALPHDGQALHLKGVTDDRGLDVFFHVAWPVEKLWKSVRFWTESDLVGSQLTVAIAGPEPSYFSDRAQGIAWPERTLTLSNSWQQVVVDIAALGADPEHLSPHSGPFGAFHFIIEPSTTYDLWIDDFAGQSRYSPTAQ